VLVTVIKPLDDLGEKIEYNNYSIFSPGLKLKLTKEKSHSNFLKVAKSAESGFSTVGEVAFDWTFGWFNPVSDDLFKDFSPL
jgi:hypothetical protein